MHEIRSGGRAIVRQILVDEGQLVAEDDPIAVLESPDGVVTVTTAVPGVVRELHIDPDGSLEEGDLVALIDES